MSSPASGWISYWEQNLLGDQQHPEFVWSDPGLEDAAIKGDPFNIQCSSYSCSTENENSKGDTFNQDSKKRARDDGSSGVQGKACREKMRRDRMNDRFVELSAVLEPDKPPKTDKASILRDAARIISQLRAEAQHYKETNSQLHETIKELKVEKNELREEKLSLKAEKERVEKRLKTVHILPGYTGQSAMPIQALGTSSSPPLSVNHSLYSNAAGTSAVYAHHQNSLVTSSSPPSSVNHSLYANAAGTSAVYAHHQNSLVFSKPPLYSDMPFSAQWIPPEVADVSKDHVLRPPVA